MNNKLETIFTDYDTEAVEQKNWSLFNTITTNLQEADHNTIVFYRLFENEKSIATFLKRLNNNTESLLVLNYIPKEISSRKNVIKIDYEDFFDTEEKILNLMYPNENKLKLVGITGTNGKTTTINLCSQISRQMGHKSLALGTIGLLDDVGNILFETGATTPSYIELRKIINRFQKNYDVLFFEVSSHALIQGRLGKLKLDCSGFTSFSQDHLDYHNTMEEYLDAKKLIYKKYLNKKGKCFIPSSNQYLKDILKNDKSIEVINRSIIDDRKSLPLFFRPIFNQDNLEIAMKINYSLWNESKTVDIGALSAPKGRFNTIEFNDCIAIIDYAHTPDALSSVCESIKESFPTYNLIVIFGCGGNRDLSKRPLMAEAVKQFSDIMIITSDNPRDESPGQIIKEISQNLDSDDYIAIEDRAQAIEHGISISRKSILLIAGKGHEEYQEIGGVKISFSDYDVVRKTLENKCLTVD